MNAHVVAAGRRRRRRRPARRRRGRSPRSSISEAGRWWSAAVTDEPGQRRLELRRPSSRAAGTSATISRPCFTSAFTMETTTLPSSAGRERTHRGDHGVPRRRDDDELGGRRLLVGRPRHGDAPNRRELGGDGRRARGVARADAHRVARARCAHREAATGRARAAEDADLHRSNLPTVVARWCEVAWPRGTPRRQATPDHGRPHDRLARVHDGAARASRRERTSRLSGFGRGLSLTKRAARRLGDVGEVLDST